MKDKILNAIDKGLMNVLSTDIADLDIDFNTSDIDNEYIPEISLNGLYDKFKENNKSVFNDKYNTKNAISLILEHNIEISLYEYEEGIRPLFMKIANDELSVNGSEIIIYIPENQLKTNNLYWQTTLKTIQDDSNGYIKPHKINGYMNCKQIADIVHNNPNLGRIPSIEYCMRLHRYGYDGYLPAIKQLETIYKYLHIINYIFDYIGYKTEIMNNREWQSSTEYSHEFVRSIDNGHDCARGKQNSFNSILPLFKFNCYKI